MRFLPSWRPFTWVIVVINLLFLFAIVGAVNGAECEAEEIPGSL